MKRNNAVGVKGRSGRKGGTDEHIRNLVVNKSWERILAKFEKKNKTPEDEKQLDYISIEIAKKTIPQTIDGNLNGNFVIKWEEQQQ